MTSRTLYAIHRWISAIAFIQLALWTASGLFFAWADPDQVRGAQVPDAHDRPLPALTPGEDVVSPKEALICLAAVGATDVRKLELRATPAGLFYVGRGKAPTARIDARTCALAEVTATEAESAARRDQPGSPGVRSTEKITDAPVEYRGKPVPAWRVTLTDEAGTVVYVDARTGDVTARRTDTWRTFDFLYGLHIMDYTSRDSVHHPLLMGASVLAALTVLSGIVLWGLRIARWLRRRGPVTPA